jgi:hypothetical protein
MSSQRHFPIRPLKAIHPGSPKGAPWIFIDPGLRADCLATYRAVRVLVIASFVLLGHPFRAWAATHNCATEVELLHSKASFDETSRQVGVRRTYRQNQQVRREVPQIAELRPNADPPKPQLMRLSTYRAHAPPRGEISDDLPIGFSLCGFTSVARDPLPRSGFSRPPTFLNTFLSEFSDSYESSPIPPVAARRYMPTSFIAQGDNRHVRC